MLKRILAVFVILVAASSASAQVAGSRGGGGGGGSSTITAGTTATSGCTDGGFLYSLASLIQCGANALNDGSVITFGGVAGSGENVQITNGTSTRNIFKLLDNATPVWTVADGGTITATGQYLGPAGTAANVSYGVTGGVNTGMYFRSVVLTTFTAGGVQVAEMDSTALNLGQTKSLCWYPAAFGNTATLCFSQEATAVAQIGSDVNGAATAQTLKSADGITGTDIAGSNFILAGGRGTGTGASGDIILQTSPALTTGTTAQTLEERFKIIGKQFNLTDNTIATFVVETLGDDTGGGGTIHYCVRSSNATTAADECGSADFNGIDVTAGAGGEVCTITKVGTPAQALSGATLAVTFAGTIGTDLCSFRVTADTSVATPTSLFIKYSIVHSGRPMTAQ